MIPLTTAFAAFNQLIPTFGAPENRVFATLVESDAGKAFLDGAWGWYGLIVALLGFTTVLGEELLFGRYLLPRMNGAFGRGDWVVSGLLFTGYHLHVLWAMPATLFDTFTLAYPTSTTQCLDGQPGFPTPSANAARNVQQERDCHSKNEDALDDGISRLQIKDCHGD